MSTWIALFRGINVGGKNILPMAKLKEDCAALKFKNVRTYIQSGNVVFESAAKKPEPLRKKIRARVQSQHGFQPQVLLLQADDLEAAIKANPFAAPPDPKSLHFFFLDRPATDADMEKIAATCAATEEFQLTERVFYLHAPDGIGRSKLAANVERHLGVVTTARNYRTVEKLRAMLDQPTS